MSVTDLCPGCLRFISFNFFSKTGGLTETKLQVENESLCMGTGSHDQDGGHTYIYIVKSL